MSGFEIAGVILGALPLMVQAVQHYGQGVREEETQLRGDFDLTKDCRYQKFVQYGNMIEISMI